MASGSESAVEVHGQQSHRRKLGQLRFQVSKLDRQDIHHVDLAAMYLRGPAQPAGQISVNARDLQRRSANCVDQFDQGRVSQSIVIAPENEIHQPLPLEQHHGTRVNIRPPVMYGEVMRRWIVARRMKQCDRTFGTAASKHCGFGHAHALNNPETSQVCKAIRIDQGQCSTNKKSWPQRPTEWRLFRLF